MEPEWSRRAMRRLRERLAAAGAHRCGVCGFSTQALHAGDASEAGIGFAFGTSWLHPLDWMDVERRPALVWHGTPEAGRHRAHMAATCRRCTATTLYDRGWYSPDDPDLTTLSDEEQVERDGR